MASYMAAVAQPAVQVDEQPAVRRSLESSVLLDSFLLISKSSTVKEIHGSAYDLVLLL